MAFTRAGLYSDMFVTSSGRAAAGLSVTVKDHGTANNSTLYVDHAKSSAASNPAVTDGTGNLTIYAAPGLYDLYSSLGGMVTVPVLPDPTEITDLVGQHDSDVTGLQSALATEVTNRTTAVSGAVTTAASDATAKVAAHVSATDPHGDRAYAAAQASSAQSAAIAAAATDATSKANAAQSNAVGSSAQKSANLSDLANAGTARSNLGLGAAATKAVGTTSADVAAGDAPAAAQVAAISAASSDATSKANAAQAAAIAASTPLLAEQSTKTGAYTASASQLVPGDTTSGAFTITLPAASVGAVVGVRWEAGTAALTVQAAGSDVIGSGSSTSFVVPLAGSTVVLQATSAGRWREVSGVKPQSALDSRYRVTPQRPPEPRMSMLANTGFTGHGVTVTAGTAALASNLNDTSDFMRGTQSASFTADPTASNNTVFRKDLTTTDFTGRGIVFEFRVDDGSTKINKVDVQVLTSTAGWTGIIDQGVAQVEAQRWAKSGEWMRWYVPFSAFTTSFYGGVSSGTPLRTDVAGIRLRFWNVTGQSVQAKYQVLGFYDEPVTAFPSGVVSFTYDDSSDTQYNAARLHLDKYGYRATLFPILERIDTAGYLTSAMIRKLHDQSGWEVGTHATTVANHALGLTGMTSDQRKAELAALRAWQVTNGYAADGPSFAYPRGYFDAASITDVAQYWQSARTVVGVVPEAVGTPYPYRLRSTNATVVSGGMTLNGLKSYVDAAKAGRCWAIFTVHNIVSSVVDQTTDILATDHSALVDYVAAQAVPVRTIREVMAAGSVT